MSRQTTLAGMLLIALVALAGPAHAQKACQMPDMIAAELKAAPTMKYLSSQVDETIEKLKPLEDCKPTSDPASCFFPAGAAGDKLKKRLHDRLLERQKELKDFLVDVIAAKYETCRDCRRYKIWKEAKALFGTDGRWPPEALDEVDGDLLTRAKIAHEAASRAATTGTNDPDALRMQRSAADYILTIFEKAKREAKRLDPDGSIGTRYSINNMEPIEKDEKRCNY